MANPLLDPSLWASPDSETSAVPQSAGQSKSTPSAAASSNPLMDADAWRTPTPAAAPTPVYSGSVVPMSRYSDGSVGFDSNAGVVGLAKRAASGLWSGATLPGDVATGKVDPSSQEAVRRSLDMATLAAPDAAVATARKVITPPTAGALKATGGAGYDALRNMSVDYSIPHVADMAARVQQGLNDKGITSRATVAPDVHAILDELQKPPSDGVAVPLMSLDQARRELGEMAGNYANKSQQKAAKAAQNAIDDFISNPPKGGVISGPADQAAQTLKEARANYAAGSRSDALNRRGDYAEFKANDSNAGQNLPNNLRKQASWFLDPMHPERRAGFSQKELDAFKQVNEGTAGINAARTVGSWLGAGHGVFAGAGMAGAGIEGYHAFGLPGLALGAGPPLVGMGAKALEKKWTQGAFDNVDNLIRQRSPLYEKQAAEAPVEVTAAPSTGGMARATMASAPAPAAVTPPVVGTNPPAQPMPKAKKGAALPPAMTPDEAARYVQQMQPGQTFARGGSVKRKSHEELVSRLMGASEKAKASTKRDTKNLLAVPDNTVARALAIAQKSI